MIRVVEGEEKVIDRAKGRGREREGRGYIIVLFSRTCEGVSES